MQVRCFRGVSATMEHKREIKIQKDTGGDNNVKSRQLKKSHCVQELSSASIHPINHFLWSSDFLWGSHQSPPHLCREDTETQCLSHLPKVAKQESRELGLEPGQDMHSNTHVLTQIRKQRSPLC